MKNAQNLTVSATIDAPVREVWEKWTLPQHITAWNQASDDWHCPRAENDLRQGGRYKARMEAKDGSMGFDFEAVYDAVVPYRQITYTLTDGRQCSTHFREAGEQTEVTTTFEAESTNPPEMQQQGWQAILNNFKKYAEGR